jgi:hypothetical protein
MEPEFLPNDRVRSGPPNPDRPENGTGMRTAIAILAALWLIANAGTEAGAETLRFVITRNGDPIGKHTIEINRAGPETSVDIRTDLAVNVLFFTAYRLQQRAGERWIDGHLVALNSTTDNNGTRHKVSVAMKGSELELNADGKISRLDSDVVPSSLWNPDFLKHSKVLDTQDGEVTPVVVVDKGLERIRSIQAHHYVMKGRYTQEVWYDDRGHLVQVKMTVSDGSVILYKPA